MKFQDLVEIVYKRGKEFHKLNPTFVVSFDTLKKDSAIYSGKKYNLHLVKFRNRNYFVITNKNFEMQFFQQFEKIQGYLKVKLKARMNTSNTSLFSLLVGTLLYLGVQIVDDSTHNDKSINSIRRMLKSGDIVCYINGKKLTMDEWEDAIKTDSDDLFEYRSSEHGNIPILESHHYMCDAFEMGEIYMEGCG